MLGDWAFSAAAGNVQVSVPVFYVTRRGNVEHTALRAVGNFR
jgi:hypothetical protein